MKWRHKKMIQTRFLLFIFCIALVLSLIYWLFSWVVEYVKFRVVLWKNKKENMVKDVEKNLLKKNRSKLKNG